jgi:hypothetical protein
MAAVKAIRRVSQNRGLRLVAALAVAGGSFLFLGLGLYRNWQELAQYEWSIDYRYLLASSAIYPVSFLLIASVWSQVIGRLGGFSDYWGNLQIYCYSGLTKYIPGNFWYVLGRAYFYEKKGVAKSLTALGSLWELALAAFSGLVVYLPLMLCSRQVYSGPLNYLLLLLAPLGFVVLYPSGFGAVLKVVLKKRAENISLIRRRDSFAWIALYAVAWLLGGLAFYLQANMICPVPLVHLPAVASFLAISGVISHLAFFIPAGLGIREVSLALLLSSFVPFGIAVVIALIFRLWMTLSEVFWTFVILLVCRLVAARNQVSDSEDVTSRAVQSAGSSSATIK